MLDERRNIPRETFCQLIVWRAFDRDVNDVNKANYWLMIDIIDVRDIENKVHDKPPIGPLHNWLVSEIQLHGQCRNENETSIITIENIQNSTA